MQYLDMQYLDMQYLNKKRPLVGVSLEIIVETLEK